MYRQITGVAHRMMNLTSRICRCCMTHNAVTYAPVNKSSKNRNSIISNYSHSSSHYSKMNLHVTFSRLHSTLPYTSKRQEEDIGLHTVCI